MSASEIAYFAIKPGEIKKIKSTGSNNARKAIKLYDDPERLLSTILVTNTVVNITFVFLAVYTSIRLFDLNTDSFPGYVIILGIIIFLLLLFRGSDAQGICFT
jgi:putative hemolysin